VTRRVVVAPLVALAVAAPAQSRNAALPALDVPAGVRVVSYFPVDAGWTEMWTKWQPTVIAADLQRLASLHANTVRAIVQPNLFGYPHPRRLYAARLRRFVALAGGARLHVQLTIFDWWYRWADVRGSETWARELLAPYAGDTRIAFVELRNELVVKPQTLAWARTLIPFVRRVLRGRTPVTVSVTGVDPARRLAALRRGLAPVRPDFFDLHYFGGGGELALDTFARARRVAEPVPLLVGETGYPTTPSLSGYGGVPRTPEAQEAAQGHFLASVAWAARADKLPPIGIWTLHDFVPEAVPDRVVTPLDPELHYGLLRVDGSEKRAVGVVRAAYSSRAPVAFNNGFEEAVPDERGELVPAEWSMLGSGAAFADDRAVARSGVASARLTPLGEGTASLSIAPPNGGVRTGVRVTVQAWARMAGTGVVFTVIEWRDRHNRLLRRDASSPLHPGPEWGRLLLTARAPTQAAYLRIDLVSQEATAPVWFDDVSFQRGPRTSRNVTNR
jgi:hypothetical protein